MKPAKTNDPVALRRAAEARLHARPAVGQPRAEADLRRLQHELEVHQIELEMQNEELRQSQAALEAGIERYTELYDFAPAGYFTLRADGTIRLVNLAGARLTGVERAWLLGRRFQLFVARSDRRAFDEFLARMLAQQEAGTIELGLVAEDRPALAVWVQGERSTDGQECRFIVTDIDARRQAERKLARSEAHLRAIVETEPEGVNILGADGALLEVNPAGLRMLEAESFQQVAHASIYSFVTEEHRAAFRQLAGKVFGGESGTLEFEIVGLKGGRRWLETHAAPLRDEAGKIVSFLGITRDITARKRTESALRDSAEQLRALAARVQVVREEERTLIAREIHDVLAQELTRLKIDLTWVAKRLGPPLAPTGQAAVAGRIGEALGQVDATITMVQRIATDLRPVILDTLGLPAAVEWLGEDFARRTGVVCRVQAGPGPTELERERATALFRILQESLTNVARYAQASEVLVELSEAEGVAILKVTDNGVGITSEQAENVRSIGLLGMKERAHAFGGTVEITGRAGAGTTVVARVPIANGGGL
ncbi:MAG: PAS domain-containing sensor histidine kinase [Opitutaceae bacterium]|nr:PAS domain-containing sensor histidine kinase [Opitutaceae bacterium]